VEVGLLYDLRNPPEWHIPTAELYAETLDHIQAMEALGFPVIWVTEHHFIDDEYLPGCLAFAAAIAARTKKVTIGSAVILLPLHDALRVAEDAAVVDVLSNGRLRLGVGLGYKLEEFDAFGIPRQHRRGRMEEGVQVIRAAWGEGPATFEGKHYNFRDINVTPKPTQKRPEIWMAGRAEPAIERAARLGDGVIIAGGAELASMYSAKRRELGTGGPNNVAGFAWALPAEDPGRAWEECGPHTTYRARNYADWYGAAADIQSDTTWNAAIDAGLNPGASARMFTSVDETIASLKQMEADGITSALYFATFPGMRPSATIPYFETMAKYVLPAVS
jgi:alkanesulfonate monooxygenase SsuD/methylene tetrahydromethanopterin reductase-like flavin-dependent oxidoreductase (luciferase family)